MNHTRAESEGIPDGSLTIACTSGAVVNPGHPAARATELWAPSAPITALQWTRSCSAPFVCLADSREGHLNAAATALEGSKAAAEFDLRAVALRLVGKGANQAANVR